MPVADYRKLPVTLPAALYPLVEFFSDFALLNHLAKHIWPARDTKVGGVERVKINCTARSYKDSVDDGAECEYHLLSRSYPDENLVFFCQFASHVAVIRLSHFALPVERNHRITQVGVTYKL